MNCSPQPGFALNEVLDLYGEAATDEDIHLDSMDLSEYVFSCGCTSYIPIGTPWA